MRGATLVKKWLISGGVFILGVLIAFFLIIASILTIGWAWDYFLNSHSKKPAWEQSYKNQVSIPDSKTTLPVPTTQYTSYPSPSATTPSQNSNNIPVDFITQAPLGVWDYLHEEACEEANVVMAYAWANNIPLTPKLAEKEILKLVDWEKNNLGFFENTSAKDMNRMASEVYGLKTTLIQNPSIEDIQREITKGHLVMIGMAGKKLQNPYFKAPGPVYHTLLFRGFDEKGFFVNDPGTRRGNNFYYSNENITEAAHDWNGSEESLLSSNPVALVFSRSN